MKNIRLILTIFALATVLLTTSCVTSSASVNTYSSSYSGAYTRKQARQTIAQTAYIINRAYEIANYYSYWENNRVSRAMYYNDYAQRLLFYNNYRSAIRYSLLAREYALDVIDNCDDYWEYFYYTYFGWSNSYGYNRNFAYADGYRDGYYDGYYANYCARHRHDYRNDPYRNMQSQWYNNDNYNRVMNSSASTYTRGESHTINRDNNTVSGTGYRGEPNISFKNINTNDYYSATEVNISRDIPDREIMANDFSKANPNISISDNDLQNDQNTIKRNTQTSKDFESKKTNNELVNSSQIKRPQTIQSSSSTINNNNTKTNNTNSTTINRANTTKTPSSQSTTTVTPSKANNTIERQSNTTATQKNNIDEQTITNASKQISTQGSIIQRQTNSATRNTNTSTINSSYNSKKTNSTTKQTNSKSKTSNSTTTLKRSNSSLKSNNSSTVKQADTKRQSSPSLSNSSNIKRR